MKKRQRILVLMVVAATAVAFAGRSYADDTNAAPAATVDDKINRLEQEIQELKHQRELDQQQAQQQAQQQSAQVAQLTKPGPTIYVGPEGFGLQSPNTNFVLRLRGYAQADGRFYLDDRANYATDTFLMRRVRPILEGTLSRDFDFRLMPDFGQGTTTLQDAYVEWHYWPWLRIRAGKFKPPVGLEQLQSDTDILFVERGLPSDLVPGLRDVGAQVSGTLFDNRVSYAAGIFNGVVDGGSSDLAGWNSKDGAARIFLQPFLNTGIAPLEGLGFGAGGTYGMRDLSNTTNLPTYKSVGQLAFFQFDKGVALDGDQLRGTPQAYYFWGPLELLGEYTVSQEEVRRGAVTDTLRNNSWQIEGGFFLSGETASYRASPYASGLTPRHPFDLRKGTWGAWEVAARYGRLELDPDAFSKTPAGAGLRFADPTKNAQDAREWEVGLNWYLNRNVKWMFDYEETDFNGGAGTETGTAFTIKNRETERAGLTEIQVLF
jgi:phosphate-selective porin OprO/OprP